MVSSIRAHVTYSVGKLLHKMVSKDIGAVILLYSSSVEKLLCKMASKDIRT